MLPEFYANIEFFVFLPAILIVINAFKYVDSVAYRIAIVASSLILISAQPSIKILYFWLLLGVFLGSYIFVLILLHLKNEAKSLFLILCIAGIITGFALLKYDFWADFSPFLGVFRASLSTSILPGVGMAYMAVKIYSVVIDVTAGRITRITLLDYASYLFFFPCFLSGPIERFPSFKETVENSLSQKALLPNISENAPRLVCGCFKSFVLAPLLQPYILSALPPEQWSDPKTLYLGFIAYYFYEYMNFSGYSDMAIATSRSMNISVSENFNFPFLALSLSDMWRRWHISLANWLRDYIFYPLTFLISKHLGFDHKYKQALSSSVAIFVTFTICGLWHGQSFGLIFFGCFSGLVMALEVTLGIYINPHLQPILKKQRWRSIVFSNVARIWTLHIAAFSFGPVLLSNDQFQNLVILVKTLATHE